MFSPGKISLKSLALLGLLAIKPVLAGTLNPFDDDPDDGSGDGTTGGRGGGIKVYTCPADQGAKYTTGGVTFELKCGFGTAQTHIRHVQAPSQAACADICAAEPRCNTCDWASDTKNCGLFPDYVQPIPYANINTWFPTEKRKDPNAPCSCQPETDVKENPVCPGDNGKTYTAEDGTFFKVACQIHTIAADNPATELIRSTTAETLRECMEICSKEPTCLSIDHVNRPGGHRLKSCDLYKSGGGVTPTTPCGDKTADMAYTIDPPEENQPDEGSIMCSTECPFANGQVYDSRFGERFHIDCGRRHGVKVIFKDEQESLKDCMDSCGALLACHSIDYQASKKLCLYGQHHGEPTNVSPGWSSAHSLGCAGACSSKGCAVPSPVPTPPVEAKCPEANGKIFEKAGKKWKLWCGLINHGANDMTITSEPDWDTCIAKCSGSDRCVRAIWNERDHNCYLRTHGNLDTPITGGEGFQSAHLVPPPPPPEPPVQAKCPEANGKIFIKNGKKFKMWCNLLNAGANDLGITPEPDWDTCIVKCTGVANCVQAIWSSTNGKCYLRSAGNLEPAVGAQSGYNSAQFVP